MAYYGNPFGELFYLLFVKTGIIWGIFLVVGVGLVGLGFNSNPNLEYEKITLTYVYQDGDGSQGHWGRWGYEYKLRGYQGFIVDQNKIFETDTPETPIGTKIVCYVRKADSAYYGIDDNSLTSLTEVVYKLEYGKMWTLIGGGLVLALLGGAGLGIPISRAINRRKARYAGTTAQPSTPPQTGAQA